MTVNFSGIKAIVTDIEGTTSSIRFVVDELFPYARNALPEFVREQQQVAEVKALIEAVRKEAAEPNASIERVGELLCQWIDDDKKVTPLKSLQGLVWQAGYESGALKGHLYADAYQQLQLWFQQGLALYVYSSGSVKAQQLLFGYSCYGDLTPWFKGYFDTHIGHKREPQSYQLIVQKIGLPAPQILFLSDVEEELDAAKEAGMKTLGLDREKSSPFQRHPFVSKFSDISLLA